MVQPLSFGGNVNPHALPGMKRLGYFPQKWLRVNEKTTKGVGSNGLTPMANTNGAILCGWQLPLFREVAVHTDAKSIRRPDRLDREFFSAICESSACATAARTRHSLRHDISRSILLPLQARESGTLS